MKKTVFYVNRNTNWRVRIVKRIRRPNGEPFGECEFSNPKTIRLSLNNKDTEHRIYVAIHECLHALYDDMREKDVSRTAKAIIRGLKKTHKKAWDKGCIKDGIGIDSKWAWSKSCRTIRECLQTLHPGIKGIDKNPAIIMRFLEHTKEFWNDKSLRKNS